MAIRVAYGKRENIQTAIFNGKIPKDCIIITKDDVESELLFYDADGVLRSVAERTRFLTYEDAVNWVKTYPSVGLVFTVYDGTEWKPYIVQNDNTLKPFNEDEDLSQISAIKTMSDEFSLINNHLSIQHIAIEKIVGLPEALAKKVDAIEGKGLSTHDLTDELLRQLQNSQANSIEVIRIAGKVLPIGDDKSVTIPLADDENCGVVKGSNEENCIGVSDDGTMSVNSLNVSKLVQTLGEELILCGGIAV